MPTGPLSPVRQLSAIGWNALVPPEQVAWQVPEFGVECQPVLVIAPDRRGLLRRPMSCVYRDRSGNPGAEAATAIWLRAIEQSTASPPQ
ncbi:hypothetical protein [Xanthomonas maliensis]|uniref:hypothetical protein n=1 Tax=Xanthomonas maliensis TaxID=1321368 RepID=UPI00039FE683|nr:hypothetical protein [Xanthomonas maliensis]KAB7772212.1 hypothetical protein CKY51_01070 [Xanthomonas maliensis]